MARVYRIIGDNGVYIGSTTKPLNERMRLHKSHRNHCVSKQLINPRIELIEECTIEDRYIREQYYIDKTADCVNHKKAYTGIPTGLPTDEYNRQYRQQHKEELNAKRTKQYECECGGRYTYSNKRNHLKTKKHQNFLKTQATNFTKIKYV